MVAFRRSARCFRHSVAYCRRLALRRSVCLSRFAFAAHAKSSRPQSRHTALAKNNFVVEATQNARAGFVEAEGLKCRQCFVVWPRCRPLGTSMAPNCQAWSSEAPPGTATDKGHAVGPSSVKHGPVRLRPGSSLSRAPMVFSGVLGQAWCREASPSIATAQTSAAPCHHVFSYSLSIASERVYCCGVVSIQCLE